MPICDRLNAKKIIVVLKILILIGTVVVAQEDQEKKYFLQITTTSAGDGFQGGMEILKNWQAGLLFTIHTGDVKEFDRMKDENDVVIWTLQKQEILEVFGRWIPYLDNPWYLQFGAGSRIQKHEITYVGWNNGPVSEFGYTEIKWPNSFVNIGTGLNWTSDLGLSGGVGYGVLVSDQPSVKKMYKNIRNEDDLNYTDRKYSQYASSRERLAYWPMYSASLGWSF